MATTIDIRKIDADINYTLNDVAKLLNLGYGSVQKLRKSGEFKNVIRIGRRFYVPGSAILEYIKMGII